jgi:predicted acyltransferase
MPTSRATEVFEAKPGKVARMATLDIFRGLCVVGMLLVNHPGDPAHVFAPFHHVRWHGWALADLVAPGFLWIVGVVVPLVIGRRLAAGLSRERLQLSILRRTTTLYVLGLLVPVVSGPDYFIRQGSWADVALVGILQLIALCYLLASSAFLWGGLRGVCGAALVCTSVYVCMLWVFSVSHHGADPWALEGNFAKWVDTLILSPVLNSGAALATVPATTVTTLSGVAVGCYLVAVGRLGGRDSLAFLAIGAVSIGLSELIGVWIPINRQLWTPSFFLLTFGSFMILLTVLDLCARWGRFVQTARPVTVLGRNAMIVFMASEVLRGWLESVGVPDPQGNWMSLWSWGYHQFLRVSVYPQVASLAMSVMYVTAFYLVAQALDRRGWYIRV